MTTPSESPESMGDAQSDGAPFLPASLPAAQSVAAGTPTLPAATPPVLPDAQPVAADVPTLPAIQLPVSPAPPTLPARPSVDTRPAPEPVAFDAKAMVESQKHIVQSPVYGQIPTGTPESVAAARALRVKAQRKRRRNRTFAWFVALVMLGGIVTAGWFGYQAFQDDQEQLDADRAAAQADGSAGAPGALTPLGNQQAVIEAIEDVNSGATASAGGFLGAVEDAQSAVDGINGTDTDASPAAPALTILDLRPEPVLRLGLELESVGGYERHVIDGRRFAAESPAEFERFVALMQAQPQVDPQATIFEALPPLAPGEIGFAIVRDGDRVLQAIIVSSDPPIHVDYAP